MVDDENTLVSQNPCELLLNWIDGSDTYTRDMIKSIHFIDDVDITRDPQAISLEALELLCKIHPSIPADERTTVKIVAQYPRENNRLTHYRDVRNELRTLGLMEHISGPGVAQEMTHVAQNGRYKVVLDPNRTRALPAVLAPVRGHDQGGSYHRDRLDH
tara:strand:- start:734 stop:1210 length:477 start_codon:yes stop_codon:yes gene_type:complete